MSHKHEEDEETVSLSSLLINNPKQIENVHLLPADGEEEQFDFGSSAGLASEMCAADELFFQGRIRSISRSESMDHIINSRSSSIKSQYSSSSGSSTGYKPRIRNQFHSHPSPSPQIRSRSVRMSNPIHLNSKSGVWSFFQTGLVRPPPPASIWGKNEISKSFGSRNSNDSIERKKKKKKRLFDINGGLFGSCKVDFVGSEKMIGEDREKEVKQAASRHRTFEWLKQLSVEDDAA